MLRLKLSGFIIVVISIFLGIGSVSASEADGIWFWAWRSYDWQVEAPTDQRGDLLAFTPEGQVNMLLENMFLMVLRRMGDTHAFVMGKQEDMYHLYFLTPTEAIDVMPLFDQAYMDSLGSQAMVENYPYFMPQIIAAGEGRYLIGEPRRDEYVLFDSAQKKTTPLDLRPWCRRECIRVSADGRFIRYRVADVDQMMSSLFVDTDLTPQSYQIYEYDLETQTERLIFEKEPIDAVDGETSMLSRCIPDQFGDRWYCELLVNAGFRLWSAKEKIIIFADGQTETVNPAWRLRLVNRQWYFLDLDRDEYDCEECVIHVFPDGNEDKAFQFQFPKMKYPIAYEDIQLLSEHYLAPNFGMGRVMLLSRAGELMELGDQPCCSDPISMDFYDEEAGFFVVSQIDDPKANSTELWRMQPLEKFKSFPIDAGPGIGSTFRDYSLVLFYGGPGGNPAAVYSYLDETLYEPQFPGEYKYDYIDAFPGGFLVVDYDRHWLTENYVSEHEAIARWTPEDGLTRLVEGAILIPDY